LHEKKAAEMNNTPPFLTIITVVYNNLPGLKYTFQSICQQTCKDFEWLVIDGGSTDGTKEWLAQLSFPLFTFISEKDRGLYDAMNKGLKMASGQFVWFMNSGDGIYSANTVEHLKLHGTHADVLYGETMLIDDQGNQVGTRSEKTTRVLPATLTARSMIMGMVVCHQSFIPKRSITAPYQLKYRFSADIDWVISCLEKSKNTNNCNSILANYLIGGLSTQNQKTGWKERWSIYVEHYGLIYTTFAHFYIVIRYIWKYIFFNKKY
jgi:glycosyltransferase involved in cell wall biosynthesis